jgi:hypothetical protein
VSNSITTRADFTTGVNRDTLQRPKIQPAAEKGRDRMVDAATELEYLRRRLRACDERIHWFNCTDSPNSRRLRDEVSRQRARIADEITELTVSAETRERHGSTGGVG